jgi:hypothetical protein
MRFQDQPEQPTEPIRKGYDLDEEHGGVQAVRKAVGQFEGQFSRFESALVEMRDYLRDFGKVFRLYPLILTHKEGSIVPPDNIEVKTGKPPEQT